MKKQYSDDTKEQLKGMSFCLTNHSETISDKLITLIEDITDENNKDKYNGIFL